MSEKKEATPEEKVALRQANVQTILLKEILKVHEKYKDKSYQEIISYKDAPSALVSSISNPEDASCFLAGTSAQLSVLTPTISFWWVKGTEKHEFMFSDHVSGKKMLDLAKSRVAGESITIKGRDTIGTDVGIQEFTWMFDNKHSGDKTLKASVSIYFGSVRELLNEKFLRFIFTQNTIEENLKQIRDKDKDEPAGAKVKAHKELDLRIRKMKGMRAPGDALHGTTQDEQANYTQIKAVVGWSIPDTMVDNSLISEEFKKSIASTQKTIMLNFTKYNLTFGEQGQVNLKIEYVGSLDAVMVDDEKSDIFAGILKGGAKTSKNGMTAIPLAISYKSDWFFGSQPENKLIDDAHPEGLLAKLIKRGGATDEYTGADGFRYCIPMARYERETWRMAKEYIRTYEDPKSPDNKKKIEEYDTGIKAVDIAESMVMARVARQKHEAFLNAIYDSGELKVAQVSNNVFDKEEKKGGKKSAFKFKILGKDKGASKGVRGIWKDSARQNAIHAAKEKSGHNKATGTLGMGSDATDPAAIDPESTGTEDSDSGKINIYYFSVGDLIDIALKTNTFIKSPTLDARIMLGSFNAGEAGIVGGENIDIPIAQVPLNVEWFSQWFTDNFINADPPRFQMSLREFINKVLEQLVAPVMNDAYSTPQTTARINFSMTTASFPKAGGTIARGSTIGESKIKQVAKSTKTSLVDALLPEVHYFIAFATIRDRKTLRGDYKVDVKKGIYHLFLGVERGLVKKFSFTEKKMPHIRAMHIENNSPGSALILPQDVELTMVGNTFFRNGNLVYIDADLHWDKVSPASLA